MPAAGLLLTGGASRRMGVDKASLRLNGSTGEVGEVGAASLAERSARLLEAVARPVLEVGPGHSSLPSVADDADGGSDGSGGSKGEAPHLGPLVAVVRGATVLRDQGWRGPVLVVATDLPRLSVEVLQWLVDHPSDRSVVPRVDGRAQPLCARYQPADLDRAVALVAAGRRSMRDLLADVEAEFVTPSDWAHVAGADAFFDVDTPEDLARLAPRP